MVVHKHHFIDLPTGFAVGFAALWALPDESASPLTALALAADPARRRLALLYAGGAAACAALACLGGTWLWMFWPALALGLVAVNYGAIGACGFQKTNGRLSWGARGLLAPYLALAWLSSRLWTRRHPNPAPVMDGVWIGRIPTGSDLARAGFAAVVDLSAEISCGARGARRYVAIPVLDLTVPAASDLRDAASAIEAARQHGTVLVCCALGYSRSAAAVVAWLLATKRAGSLDGAIEIARRARPALVLESAHYTALAAFA